MTRNRNSAKQAGARFERLVADYLAAHVSPFIDRKVRAGAKDRGDIANLMAPLKGRIVVEAKDCAKVQLGPWLTEAETERINDGADVGVVIFKAHGKGAAGDQRVLMTLRDFVCLVAGDRPAD